MQLWQLIIKENRFSIFWLVIASSLSALVGVGVIAFINESLTQPSHVPQQILAKFIGLLLLLFFLRFVSQFSLTYLGHTFLFKYLNNIIKRILATDIASIERIGSSKIIASLSKDISSIQSAFIAIPAFIQGLVLSITAIAYLGYLSFTLLLIVLAIIIVMILVGGFLVKHVYKHFELIREAEDSVYKSYETVLNGRKELSLNRYRAKLVYDNEYKLYASKIRQHSIIGETLHFTALNWADVMVLASIGVVFFLANILQLADMTTAMTFAVTILFLQSPLIDTIGAFPLLLEAQVSFDKIKALKLKEPRADIFKTHTISPDWLSIKFEDICYEYKDESHKPTFGIGEINFTLNKGDVVFLIGGNGSGKSTFAKIATGLYQPTSGAIYLDNQKINKQNIYTYRQYFSAIFTDVHLFKNIMSQKNTLSDNEVKLMQEWLKLLKMDEKLDIDVSTMTVLNEDLSQGQKKRLAMLIAVMEQRDLLLLDEWAADQDPQFRRFFYHYIIPKLKEMGKTLIVISHDDTYFEKADRLLQMKNGKLIELFNQERINATKDAIATIS